jgi:Domain of unknown function (DUF4124)
MLNQDTKSTFQTLTLGAPKASFASALIVIAIALPSLSFAQAEIYRCEGDTGVPLYQNTPGKNCKKLDLQPLTAIPAPKLPAAAAVKPSAGTSNGVVPGKTASDFPKVDTGAQNQRDSDRRKILDDEVKKEENRLADLKKEFNNGEPERRGDERNFEKYQSRVQKLREDIARTEGNIGSLRREIGMIKG